MLNRDIRLFVDDIKDSVDAIFSYVHLMSFEDFIDDRKTYSAVIREFEIIGEASKHLPSVLTENYTEIEWRDIKDFRNLLIHQYFGIDHQIVWNTILKDLPKVKQVIDSIAEEMKNKKEKN